MFSPTKAMPCSRSKKLHDSRFGLLLISMYALTGLRCLDPERHSSMHETDLRFVIFLDIW